MIFYCVGYTLYVSASLDWQEALSTCPFVRPFIQSYEHNILKMNRFCCKLAQVVHRIREWNDQLGVQEAKGQDYTTPIWRPGGGIILDLFSRVTFLYKVHFIYCSAVHWIWSWQLWRHRYDQARFICHYGTLFSRTFVSGQDLKFSPTCTLWACSTE